jgi:segregation and condensation protein B
VAVSKGVIDGLMETGWIKIKGRRQTPGRPITLGTTDAFLEHFGLEDLSVLPGKIELEAEGLLSDVIPKGFETGELPGMDETDIDTAVATGHEEDQEAEFVADFIGEDGADDTDD